jgi:hypothetical protein
VIRLSRVTCHDEHGEMVPTPVLRVRSQSNAFSEGWLALAIGAAKGFSGMGLKAREHDLLWMLLGTIDYENYVSINQRHIAAATGIHPVTVSRSLARLVELGIVTCTSLTGSRQYRLNPHFVWRGSGKNHHNAIEGEHLKLTP